MQSRANLIKQEHYVRSSYNVPGRHPTHRTRDGGRAFKTDVDRDVAHLYGRYGASRPEPPFALYGDGTRNWYLRDGRGHMDSPFGPRGPDYHMVIIIIYSSFSLICKICLNANVFHPIHFLIVVRLPSSCFLFLFQILFYWFHPLIIKCATTFCNSCVCTSYSIS